jgi:hypothetical protein
LQILLQLFMESRLKGLIVQHCRVNRESSHVPRHERCVCHVNGPSVAVRRCLRPLVPVPTRPKPIPFYPKSLLLQLQACRCFCASTGAERCANLYRPVCMGGAWQKTTAPTRKTKAMTLTVSCSLIGHWPIEGAVPYDNN